MTAVDRNKAVVRRWLHEIWNEGRVDVVGELFAASYARHEGNDPNRGPGVVRKLREEYAAAFADLRFSEDDLVAEGDRVAIRWTATARHVGPFMGIPATGRTGTVVGMDFFRLEDGKIVESWPCFDALGMLRQLGALR